MNNILKEVSVSNRMSGHDESALMIRTGSTFTAQGSFTSLQRGHASSLARLELPIAFGRLLNRIGEFELDLANAQPISFAELSLPPQPTGQRAIVEEVG